MQYVGGSTALLNQRISIHRRIKSRCEISIYHYRNVCNNATFSIQATEKLPGNSYERCWSIDFNVKMTV